MIKVKNLKKSYKNLEVLKDINMEVKQGEVVVIIGPSGSGKSTFLRCLNYLESPDKGEIQVGHVKVNNQQWYFSIIIYSITKQFYKMLRKH